MKRIYYCLSFVLLFIFSITFVEAASYQKIQCGDELIPYAVPQVVRVIFIILQIATPIIIIIFGMLDFLKGVIAQKEDEIKKGQQTFIRRLAIGALVFLVFIFVEFIIGFVAPKDENQNMWNCIDCFINGNCTQSIDNQENI